MALFRHPSLIRGTVHTPHGAFVVVRSLVDIAEELGTSLGWEPVDGSLMTASETPGTGEPLSARRVSMNRADAN